MRKRVVILMLLICLFSLHLWASIQGKIEGIVIDNSGNPIEKVTVSIISSRISSRHYEVRTNKEGKFAQVGLWPGYYQISFKKEGYMPVSQEVKVNIDESTSLEVKMEKAEEILARSLSKADKLFQKGNKLYEEKKYREAIHNYEEAISLNSTQWGYHLNLGLAYKKMEIKEEALAAFRQAVELNPESYSSNKELGETLAQSGNFGKAKKFYQKAAELSPDDPDAFYNLGVCLTNLGESEEALENFLKAVKIKEDYADAYYQLGTLYIGQNKTDEAVECIEKFLELAPDHEKADLARQLLDYLKKDNQEEKQ
jgi:tetratricopeptide (TPR) repeat protein